MHTLIPGIAMVTSLLAVSLVTTIYLKNKRGATRQQKIKITATVVCVQMGQDWKHVEGWERDPWDGNLKQKKAWKTFYTITAQWTDPQTMQVHTFSNTVWADEMSEKPLGGSSIIASADAHKCGRYTNFQFLSSSSAA